MKREELGAITHCVIVIVGVVASWIVLRSTSVKTLIWFVIVLLIILIAYLVIDRILERRW